MGENQIIRYCLQSLVSERRRNPIDEAKSNLPFYEGRDAGDKDTCASLEDWLSLLEEITGSGLWDDSGRVQLARESLRGEALGSWWLWRRDNRTDSWASLADTLTLMHGSLPCAHTAICKFLKVRRRVGESMLSFFHRVYAAAADLRDIDKDYGDDIDKFISFVFAMEFPKEFLATQKDFSGMRDAREFFRSWLTWADTYGHSTYIREVDEGKRPAQAVADSPKVAVGETSE